MKFRSKMVERSCIRQFSSIVLTLCKLAKESVLRLTKDKIYFIIFEENSIPRRVLAWCILEKKSFFEEYNLQAKNGDNEIYVEFSLELLAVSMNSLKNVDTIRSVNLKLTEKITPSLTVEIELVTSMGHSRQCVHDVPVTLASRDELEDYKEPPKHNYNISIEMPDLKMLRNIVDRLKKLDQFVTVSAENAGGFSLEVETTCAVVTTSFQNLTVFKPNGGGKTSARVDIRKLYHFLFSDQLHPQEVTCNILNGHLIHQHLKQEQVELDYYLLAVDD